MGWLIDDLDRVFFVFDLGPLGLDEDIYKARDPCTWLVHVLRLREYRLSDNIAASSKRILAYYTAFKLRRRAFNASAN